MEMDFLPKKRSYFSSLEAFYQGHIENLLSANETKKRISQWVSLNTPDSTSTLSIQDRNKFHAKKTRLRRKLYVEALENNIEVLKYMFDAELKRISSFMEIKIKQKHQRNWRLQLFLVYWNICMTDVGKWNQLMDRDCEIVMPNLHFPGTDTKRGVLGLLQGCCDHAMICESVLRKRTTWLQDLKNGKEFRWRYHLIQDNSEMDIDCIKNNSNICNEVLEPTFFRHLKIVLSIGENIIFEELGLVRCIFGENNVIIKLEIEYDVQRIWDQFLCALDVKLESPLFPKTISDVNLSQFLSKSDFSSSENGFTMTCILDKGDRLLLHDEAFGRYFKSLGNDIVGNESICDLFVLTCEMKNALVDMINDVCSHKWCSSRILATSHSKDLDLTRMSLFSTQIDLFYFRALPLDNGTVLLDIEKLENSLDIIGQIFPILRGKGPITSKYPTMFLSKSIRTISELEMTLGL